MMLLLGGLVFIVNSLITRTAYSIKQSLHPSSTSRGTPHFRLSASKLSKPSCSAWPSEGNQLQWWPLPLCNFKLLLFKVILICFNYGYLDKGQEVGGISMWKNKLMKTTNEKIVMQICCNIIFIISVFRILEFFQSKARCF